MCGINGFINGKNSTLEKLTKDINLMNDLIINRGPDDDGIFVESNNNINLAMGMRRLSIIDLNSGKQPIFSEDKNLVIVFNGEIYNYLGLKRQLEQKGVLFKTNSDTEVILKLYEQEGEASFKLLDGMFAFSIYDKKKNKVFIARDFFGEKPLYYSNLNDEFIWGSELKSVINKLKIKPTINFKGINLFFRLTYIPAPYTIYDGINKLEPNHYLVYDLGNSTFSINSIELPQDVIKNKDISFNAAKAEVKDLVNESVISRSVSDVPLGTFLSGGVDSSIVSLCLARSKASPIDTFSIGFEKKSFDETDKSRIVAKQLGSKHHEFIIGENDLKNNIHEIMLNFDEPFSDTASLPTYLVSKKTSDYVKVALTGDGGDEIFGGYNKYYVGKLNTKYTSIIPETIHEFILKTSNQLLSTKDDNRGKRFKIRKMLGAIDYNGGYYWDIISLANSKDQLSQLLLNEKFMVDPFEYYKNKLKIFKPTSLTDFRQIDKIMSLEGGMLAKVDRTSMLNSLECRAPFLNKNLWNYTNSLPENFLMNGWNKKHILKEAFKSEFPYQFLEKSKQGFGSPVGDWLRSSLKNELESYIDLSLLKSQGIFNIENIVALVKNHLTGKNDNTFRVWAFYCFQKWYCHNYLG